MERNTFKARERYRPPMWEHQPKFEAYSDHGEPWFGFEAVRDLRGLPPEILLVPLFGHTLGHSGVRFNQTTAGCSTPATPISTPRQINGSVRKCAFKVGLFQWFVTTDRKARFHNENRLRDCVSVIRRSTYFAPTIPFEVEDRGLG